jgi:hypothetical protein
MTLGVGFEVLTTMDMTSTISWDITPCSPLKFNRRFGIKYRLHLQCRRMSRARNQRGSRWPGFTLGLFFYTEDGGDVFLRNVG